MYIYKRGNGVPPKLIHDHLRRVMIWTFRGHGDYQDSHRMAGKSWEQELWQTLGRALAR